MCSLVKKKGCLSERRGFMITIFVRVLVNRFRVFFSTNAILIISICINQPNKLPSTLTAPTFPSRQASPDESPKDPAPGDPRDAAAQAPPPGPEAQACTEEEGRRCRLRQTLGPEGEGGQGEAGRGNQEEAIRFTEGVAVVCRKGQRQ